MWAMFVRPKVDGKQGPWRFEGLQEHDEIVSEIEEIVVEENGERSFFAVSLPE